MQDSVALKPRLVSTETFELLQMPRDRKGSEDTEGALIVAHLLRPIDLTLTSVDKQE